MKSLIITLLLLCSTAAYADGGYQLGVILGEPTGISGKKSLGNNRSVDIAFANSFSDHLDLVIHSDYLIENARSFSIGAAAPLELYFGIGLRVGFFEHKHNDDDLEIGPRAPIGLTYTITNPNLQFFGELAMILNVIPDTDVDLDAGIGVRYMF